jgi:hypothetical protein
VIADAVAAGHTNEELVPASLTLSNTGGFAG